MPSTVTDRLNGLTTSVAVKAPCRAATTANITLAGLITTDGVALAARDRVFVPFQTDKTENGLYNAASGDWVRCTDFDGSLDVVGGTQVSVVEGTAYASTIWRTVGDGPIMPGSDEIEFEKSIFAGVDTLIFRQSGAGAVNRPAQAKMREHLTIEDFGGVGDPSVDNSAAMLAMMTEVRAQSAQVAALDNFKVLMPTAHLGRGIFRLTLPGVITDPFDIGGVFAGIHLEGLGKGQSVLLIDCPDMSDDNYVADFGNCSRVTVERLAIIGANTKSRFARWGPHGAGGAGSGWTLRDAIVQGLWKNFFSVRGTALGSETKWWDVLGTAGQDDGEFFRIEDTNPQSVNHAFYGCTIGGRGTVFKLLAGGHIAYHDGFSSLDDDAIFMDIDAIGADIGGGNGNITIDGTNFETSGGVTTGMILRSNSAATVTFRGGNWFSMRDDDGHYVVDMGTAPDQRGGRLIIDGTANAGKKTRFRNGVSAEYRNPVNLPDWQDFMTIERGTTSAKLAPQIEIAGTYIEDTIPMNPRDCNPRQLTNSYTAHPEIIPQFRRLERHRWTFRAGNSTDHPGLVIGLGNAYGTSAYFAGLIPLGARLRWIRPIFTGNNPISTGERSFKVTDASGNILLPEWTIAAPVTSYPYEPEPTWVDGYVANLEADRELRFWGKADYGIAPALDVDWGGFEVEYD